MNNTFRRASQLIEVLQCLGKILIHIDGKTHSCTYSTDKRLLPRRPRDAHQYQDTTLWDKPGAAIRLIKRCRSHSRIHWLMIFLRGAVLLSS